MLATDKRKIEEQGVDVLSRTINSCSCLSACFQRQDKTVGIDGHIEVYASDELTNQNWLGNIPVQIKGKEKKAASTDHAKHNVKVSHLQLFLKEGGVIFFVVHGISSKNPAVYYAKLLPYELTALLNSCAQEQKTKQIKLKPFPSKQQEIIRICYDFLRDSEKQLPMIGIGAASLPELTKRGLPIQSFEFTTTFFKGELPMNLNSFRAGTYIYAKTPFNFSYPIVKLENVVRAQIEYPAIVSAGDIAYKTTITTGESKESGPFTSFFGFVLTGDQSHARLDYVEEGTFRERYKSSRLALAILQNQIVMVGETIIHKDSSPISNSNIKMLEEKIQSYALCVELLDQLHIKVDWDLDDLEPDDIRQLNFMIAGIVKKETGEIQELVSPLINAEIQGKRIKLVLQQLENGSYKMVDALNPTQSCFVISDPKTTNAIYAIPPLLIFNEDDYRYMCNLDLDCFEASLEESPLVSDTLNHASNKLLEMLKAYDRGAVCSEELIHIAERLSQELLGAQPEDKIANINSLQIKKRLGTLTEGDREYLRELVISPENAGEYTLLAAAYLLLNDQKSSLQCLRRAEDNDRKKFMQWPISNLIEDKTIALS